MPDSDLSPFTCQVLAVLADFEPAWALSGRAALQGLSGMPNSTSQLDLVWCGRDRLRSLSRAVRRTLTDAGLEAVRLGGSRRQAWIGVLLGESGCLLRLVAQPGLPLEPRIQKRLAGVSVEVETPREVLAATLCLLEEKPEVQDLESLYLLLASGISLEWGFVDAPLRKPDFSALDLAWRLKVLRVEDPKLQDFKEDLVSGILDRSIPDSRAS